MRTSRVFAVLAALGSALALTACGSGQSATTTPDDTSAAASSAPAKKEDTNGIQPKLENGVLYGVVLKSADRDTRFGDLGLEDTLILRTGKGQDAFTLNSPPQPNTYITVACSSRKKLGVQVDESNIASGAVYYHTVKDNKPIAFVDSRWINTDVPGSAMGDEAPPCFFGSKPVIKKAG